MHGILGHIFATTSDIFSYIFAFLLFILVLYFI